MPIYRFLCFNRARKRMAGQFIRCEDANEARQHAHAMLDRRMIERVEVWDDQRQVYKVTRRSASLRMASSESLRRMVDGRFIDRNIGTPSRRGQRQRPAGNK